METNKPRHLLCFRVYANRYNYWMSSEEVNLLPVLELFDNEQIIKIEEIWMNELGSKNDEILNTEVSVKDFWNIIEPFSIPDEDFFFLDINFSIDNKNLIVKNHERDSAAFSFSSAYSKVDRESLVIKAFMKVLKLDLLSAKTILSCIEKEPDIYFLVWHLGENNLEIKKFETFDLYLEFARENFS